MPAKTNTKVRRTPKTKRGNKNNKVAVPHFFKPGPTIQYADFAYAIQPGLTETVLGTGQLYVLALNSIFDPDVTGIGSVAMGYGSYSNFFTRYRVVKARLQVTATPYGTSGGAMLCGVMLGPNSTISATPRTWSVQTNSFSKLLHSATPGQMFKFDRTIDLASILGVTQNQFMTDFDYSASFGTNPAKQAYAVLWVYGVGSAAAVASFEARVTYHTELSQPLQSVTV